MLQYPTNVYPQNVAVGIEPEDAVTEPNLRAFPITFTFNGDKLTRYYLQLYDAETHNQGYASYAGFTAPKFFNGDTVETGMSYDEVSRWLSRGRDYVYRFVLGQTDDNGNNDYSIYVGRGRVIEKLSDNVIKIKNKINNIYAMQESYGNPYRTPMQLGQDTNVSFGMVIQIGNETRLITSYEYETGSLSVDRPFTSTVGKDTNYKLYSNYLITPFYYFKLETNPVIDISATLGRGMITCNGSYSQAEGDTLKYYKIKAVRREDDKIPLDFASYETDRIYSYTILGYFIDWYPLCSYTVTLETCSQNNIITTKYIQVKSPGYNHIEFIKNFRATYDDEKGAVSLEWENDIAICEHFFAEFFEETDVVLNKYYSVKIYREDIDTGKTEFVGTTGSEIDKTETVIYKDPKVRNTKRYRYTIFAYKTTSNADYVTILKSNIIEINDLNWIVSKLRDGNITIYGAPYSSRFKNYDIGRYYVEESWKFMIEVEDVTITQNMDKTLHVGSAQFPLLSRSDTLYMSGTLSAMLGYIQCPTNEYIDNIELIKAWRKFIVVGEKYLLKSPKGDIWLVSITDNPTTGYDESNTKNPTRFTFSWVEVDDVDNYLYDVITNSR